MAITINAAKSTDSSKTDERFGLTSVWSQYYSPPNSTTHGRWEGELDSLVVYGEVPKEIDGTFYRILVDPFFPLHVPNPPIEGDGNVCAFRIQDGRVDMKVKYLETERYLLERKANRRLFGIYRNPFSNHPCVRAANDSTGNTNLVSWAGHILALSERGLPYAVDPDTLQTRTYDPFQGQVKAKTFTAHPKVDPYRNQLVVWGFEAKGLRTPDIVLYAINPDGKIQDETWIKDDRHGMIHDAWVTKNWIVLATMPFEANSIDHLQAGSQHWEYKPDRPMSFLVCPRNDKTPRPSDWEPGEYRRYTWENGVIFHTGAAWEAADGWLVLESHFIPFNIFPIYNPPGLEPPKSFPTGSWVRWTIDVHQPTNTKLEAPEILLESVCDFPRTDERFLTQQQHIVFLLAMNASNCKQEGEFALNTLVKINSRTGEMMVFDPGHDSSVWEPIFIPRSEEAPEGDGWVMAMVEKKRTGRSELVVLDSNDFSKPVAIIQLPFQLRSQVHGNWVPNPTPGIPLPRLVKPVQDVTPSKVGALETL